MLRTPDGRLVILDFGLMTTITDDQRYGMIEAVVSRRHSSAACGRIHTPGDCCIHEAPVLNRRRS
eukprot:2674270-Prymnesium_polylepis.1